MGLSQPGTVSPLTMAELQKLPTHRILAYLNKLQVCENSVEQSDLESSEVTIEGIVFKDSEAWQKQYAMVKAVLATRPNVEIVGKDSSGNH